MTVIQVGTELELNQAIATVDKATSGSFTIQLTADITESTDTGGTVTFGAQTLSAPPDLYALNLASGVTVTIDGAGHALDGANTYRGLFVYAGTVAIQDLTIQNTVAQGGAGGSGRFGAGGGAGLGGGGSQRSGLPGVRRFRRWIGWPGPRPQRRMPNEPRRGQIMTSPSTPFSHVTIIDHNITDPDNGGTDSLSITFSGGGTLTDGADFAGTRTLSGSNGRYTLTATPADITAERGGVPESARWFHVRNLVSSKRSESSREKICRRLGVSGAERACTAVVDNDHTRRGTLPRRTPIVWR